MINIPYHTINWQDVPKMEYKGESGVTFWQTIEFPGLRIRIVEYSQNYVADHWCKKGHIVYCLEGELITEMENGESFHLHKGMSYVVSDEMSSHRSVTDQGAKLLIIDGDFLRNIQNEVK